jgi:hypothetical protein
MMADLCRGTRCVSWATFRAVTSPVIGANYIQLNVRVKCQLVAMVAMAASWWESAL